MECGRVWEWTLTLPSELPFWELEFRWSPKFLENDCKGQNPSHWRVFYIIGKLLKHRCLKWACVTHLDIWSTSYGQRKAKSQNVSLTLDHKKSGFDPIRLHSGGVRHVVGKLSTMATTLVRPHLDWRSSQEVIVLQSCGSPNPGNGSPETKSHLGASLVERCKVYYMGEGGGFPRVRAVVNLVSPRSHVVLPSTKGAPALC
jgi:hypothetical protein